MNIGSLFKKKEIDRINFLEKELIELRNIITQLRQNQVKVSCENIKCIDNTNKKCDLSNLRIKSDGRCEDCDFGELDIKDNFNI